VSTFTTLSLIIRDGRVAAAIAMHMLVNNS